MRITGNRIIDLSAAATAKNQIQVAAASAEVSSGLHVARASDDPTAWVAAERAKLHRTLEQASGSAVAASHERLAETDGALATIQDVMAQVRTLAVQGATTTYTTAQRAGIAVEVRALFGTALASANSQASDGEYLLAGSQSLAAPFDAAGNYLGDNQTRDVPITESEFSTATVSGGDLTIQGGVDVFQLLDRVALALEADDQVAVASTLDDLETAVNQISLARARGGGAMNVFEQTRIAQTQLDEHLSSEISRFVEGDTAAAASDLAKASQALEVSRAVSAHIIGLLDPRGS